MICAICNVAGMENTHKVIVTDGDDAYDVCDKCWTEILRIRDLTPSGEASVEAIMDSERRACCGDA